jgi:hypothetical protein
VCPVPDPTYAKSDDLFASSYALRQASGYEFDPGLIALPLASSDPNAQPVIVRCHAPIVRRQVEWGATTQGKPPIVPAPDTQKGGEVFLGGFVALPMPAMSPQRTGWNWKVGGTYSYVCSPPKTLGVDDLPTGGFPFTVGNDLNVRRSLAASESPGAPGNTMTDVDSPYLHTTFPAFCFDSGLIT